MIYGLLLIASISILAIEILITATDYIDCHQLPLIVIDPNQTVLKEVTFNFQTCMYTACHWCHADCG